jgi:NAD(P)H-dependent nitrite reductase small subunit
MTEYLVAKIDDMSENSVRAVKAGRHVVAVYRVDGEFYALHNTCPHKGGAMCDGMIVPEKLVVRCPWHHWNWRLDSGELESDPRQKIRQFDVKVVGDEVVLTV